MPYAIAAIIGLVALHLYSRFAMRKKAKELVYGEFLPQVFLKDMADQDLGSIGTYIEAHQQELHQKLAVNGELGRYGAGQALQIINVIQALSNDDAITAELDQLRGDERLKVISECLRAAEPYLK